MRARRTKTQHSDVNCNFQNNKRNKLNEKRLRRQCCVYLNLSQKKTFNGILSLAPFENNRKNAANPSDRFSGVQKSQTGFVEYKYRGMFILIKRVFCTLLQLNAVGYEKVDGANGIIV